MARKVLSILVVQKDRFVAIPPRIKKDGPGILDRQWWRQRSQFERNHQTVG